MLGSATLDDVKRRLLPKFVALSSDEMYRVRKASGECLVDVSRALGVLPWRLHFGDVWNADNNAKGSNSSGGGGDAIGQQQQQQTFYKVRTPDQILTLQNTIHECHEIRRRALCAIAKKLLDDTNKFVRYGMMQFLGPLIASFYPLDRGSMIGSMGGLLYDGNTNNNEKKSSTEGKSSKKSKQPTLGVLSIGVESVDVAKCSTGLERVILSSKGSLPSSSQILPTIGELCSIENILSYNHSLHGLELILHGESSLNHAIL